ncbi:MAG: hypothetical protein A2096_13455 [Spirochaetes bacterium GWF1_41_5]|nr:MAG: hypothetical protein A2096_13455 [Spirochaetes bacterium GWF1_41_5]
MKNKFSRESSCHGEAPETPVLSAVEVMKIIEPPAPLEYTEVTEPDAQPYGLRLQYFSVYSVLSRAQPEWLNLFSRESLCPEGHPKQ